MTRRLRISNRDARRLWLSAQGLAPTPTGPLDLDAIRVVSRPIITFSGSGTRITASRCWVGI